MRVHILKRKKAKTPRADTLRKKAETILADLGLLDAELSVLLTDDDEIWALNREYRGKDRPTDVLSFSQTEGDFPGVEPDILGDVVISIDTAGRQAEDKGVSLEREIDILLIHGILHLAGYDHEKSREEERRMREREKALLSQISPSRGGNDYC